MRSLRHYLLPTFGIRINAIAPLATATGMVPDAVQKGFSKIGVPVNTPEQIAEITLGLVAGSHKGQDGGNTAQIGLGPKGGPCNGLTIYVEGGKGVEIEEGLVATRDEWLGKGPNERLMKAGAWLASVSHLLLYYDSRIRDTGTRSVCSDSGIYEANFRLRLNRERHGPTINKILPRLHINYEWWT